MWGGGAAAEDTVWAALARERRVASMGGRFFMFGAQVHLPGKWVGRVFSADC
jgi:hypothetical protein